MRAAACIVTGPGGKCRGSRTIGDREAEVTNGFPPPLTSRFCLQRKKEKKDSDSRRGIACIRLYIGGLASGLFPRKGSERGVIRCDNEIGIVTVYIDNFLVLNLIFDESCFQLFVYRLWL